MSDTSQGEGWWQASDGKWYAPQPETRPDPPTGFGDQPTKKPRGGCFWTAVVAGGVILGLVVLIGGCAALIGGAADEADEAIDRENREELAEATITDCSTDNATGFMQATVEVTNGSGERSTYTIDVVFENPAGDQIDSTFASVASVEPDQTATAEALTLTESGGEFECRVTSVERFASP